jgi:hypothetical protein
MAVHHSNGLQRISASDTLSCWAIRSCDLGGRKGNTIDKMRRQLRKELSGRVDFAAALSWLQAKPPSPAVG